MVNRKVYQRILLVASAWALFLLPASFGGIPEPKDLGVDLGFAEVPLENTCEGADLSPQIEIKGCNAVSMAIIMEDPDAPSGSFIHWIIWNIPPIRLIPSAMPRNATIDHPFPARQGYNDFGEIGYAGPCPPPGKPHRYVFRVFGLDGMLEMPAGASAADLREAMQGRVVQEGQAAATFGR